MTLFVILVTQLKKSVIQYKFITVLQCETSTAYNSASQGHGKIQKTPMAIVVSSHSFTVLRCRIKPTCSLKTRHLLTCCDMLKWSLAKSKNSSDCCNIFFFSVLFQIFNSYLDANCITADGSYGVSFLFSPVVSLSSV